MKALSLIILMLAASLWGASPCGFSRLQEWAHTPKLQRPAARTATTCSADSLYDSVYVHTTSHFRIYYTRQGPHAVLGADKAVGLPPFIDTLAHQLENAYSLHTQVLGMKPPKPMDTSHQYRRSDFANLYPVEVLELTLLRDNDYIMGQPCEGCYGLTYPGDTEDSEATVLLIDNDFLYSTDSSEVATLGSCSYSQADQPLISAGVNYHESWNQALRVTAMHELYHGSQLRYQDFNRHYHFWFEASAVGVEEVGAPEVNDYWQYLQLPFLQPDTPVTSTGSLRPYGQAPLYLYLRSRLGVDFDSRLWSYFSASPSEGFAAQLKRLASYYGLEGSELFHDYAAAVFYSGGRDTAGWQAFAADQPSWPAWKLRPYTGPPKLKAASFVYLGLDDPELPALASSATKASLLQWQDGSKDSSALLLSLLEDSSSTNLDTMEGPARAYPNPWRGNSLVCFGPLLASATGVEIRAADGSPLARLDKPQGQESVCWNGEVRGQRPAPGVLHWRVLPHGKNAVLLVIF